MILETRRYKAGYEVRAELRDVNFEAEVLSYGDGDKAETDEFARELSVKTTVIVKAAYTPEGNYIGEPRFAHRLCKKRGIKPELATNHPHKVCSIGFCEREQKWYGWSHRAIFGFGIGDTVKEGDCTASSGWTDEYLAEHPEEDTSLPVGFTAHNLDDAKTMATAFAESVS